MAVMGMKPQAPRLDGLSRNATPTRAVPAADLPVSARRRFRWPWRGTMFSLMGLIVAVIGVVGFKAVMASSHVITKNTNAPAPALAGVINPNTLTSEGDGRINILLLGIGGSGHAGGSLSDTVMVASIDPVQNTVAMLSIPRDLYVQIPGHGSAKINAATSYGGPELSKKVVSGILGVPIHYYVQLDFSGFKQAVNAVGGVEVVSPTALADPTFPCDNDKGECGFALAAGPHHMDGTLALRYARCRHGSCGNDFGRAARQQQLLVALREKAMQASTLTNPVKVSNLIDTVGSHLRTDIQLSEIQKLAEMSSKLDTTKTTTTVLDTTPQGLLRSGEGLKTSAGAILIPKAGTYNYREIQDLTHRLFADGYIQKEAARIAVKNGTAGSGVEAAVAKQLAVYQYNIIATGVAAQQTHKTSVIIDYTGGKKPYTVAFLQKRFKATLQRSSQKPNQAAGSAGADIDIIVGGDYNVSLASTSARSSDFPTSPNL